MKTDFSGVICYSKERLRNFIKEALADGNVFAKRDFVEQVREYVKTSSERALFVTGLRSTGKTVGILQGISADDTLYLCPLRKGSASGTQVVDILEDRKPKCIVIDEYSWINDPEQELSRYLAGLIKTPVRVILTGTESAVVHGLRNTDFIHRAREIHTTYLSYEEYRRIYGLEESPETCRKYLQEGGLLGIPSMTDRAALRDYIKNAIVDNISSFVPQYSPEQVKLSVYTIFYECIVGSQEINGIKTAPVFRYKPQASYEEFLEDFGVRTDIPLDRAAFDTTASQMESLGIVVKVENLRRTGQYRVYVTNQAITSKLIQAIYGEDILETSHAGYLFESAVVCHARFRKNDVCTIRYLYGRDRGEDYEIDFVLIENKEAYLFECKYNAGSGYKINDRSSILKEVVENLLGAKDIDVCGRYVIYQGEPKVLCQNGRKIVYTNDWDVVSGKYRQFQDMGNRLAASDFPDPER